MIRVAELMRAQGIANEGALRALLADFGCLTDAELRQRRLGRTARRMSKRGECVRIRHKGATAPVWSLNAPAGLSLEAI